MRSKPTFSRLAITCYHFLWRNSSAQENRSVLLRMESTSVNSVNPTASDASAQTWAIRPFFLSSPGVEASRCSSYILGRKTGGGFLWSLVTIKHDHRVLEAINRYREVSAETNWEDDFASKILFLTPTMHKKNSICIYIYVGLCRYACVYVYLYRHISL